jgi:DNA-binding SARP family transcriptional activator
VVAREIQLLGPVRVVADGAVLALPPSRKVRALLAYLILAGPQTRSRLCDLFWDQPNDPRAELRWSLSKLRGVLDDDDHKRVVATGQSQIGLDLADCRVDVHELESIVRDGVEKASDERLAEVAALANGDFLDGTMLDGAEMSSWLVARRQRVRAQRTALLAEVARRAPAGSPERSW